MLRTLFLYQSMYLLMKYIFLISNLGCVINVNASTLIIMHVIHQILRVIDCKILQTLLAIEDARSTVASVQLKYWNFHALYLLFVFFQLLRLSFVHLSPLKSIVKIRFIFLQQKRAMIEKYSFSSRTNTLEFSLTNWIQLFRQSHNLSLSYHSKRIFIQSRVLKTSNIFILLFQTLPVRFNLQLFLIFLLNCWLLL